MKSQRQVTRYRDMDVAVAVANYNALCIRTSRNFWSLEVVGGEYYAASRAYPAAGKTKAPRRLQMEVGCRGTCIRKLPAFL